MLDVEKKCKHLYEAGTDASAILIPDEGNKERNPLEEVIAEYDGLDVDAPKLVPLQSSDEFDIGNPVCCVCFSDTEESEEHEEHEEHEEQSMNEENAISSKRPHLLCRVCYRNSIITYYGFVIHWVS